METFDELDLVEFNDRDMERIKQIHADEVSVYNPDGKITEGMTAHLAEEFQFLFDTFDFVDSDHSLDLVTVNGLAESESLRVSG